MDEAIDLADLIDLADIIEEIEPMQTAKDDSLEIQGDQPDPIEEVNAEPMLDNNPMSQPDKNSDSKGDTDLTNPLDKPDNVVWGNNRYSLRARPKRKVDFVYDEVE